MRTPYLPWPNTCDLRHALNGGDFARQQGLGIFVQVLNLHRVGHHRDVHDRLVVRIDLEETGRARQRLGQLAQRRADPRLNVLGGKVNIAVEGELDGDIALADGAVELISSMAGMVENEFSSGRRRPRPW